MSGELGQWPAMMVECPRCDGLCEEVFEPPGWWHGSGVFAESRPCRLCGETGEVPEGTLDIYDDEGDL